MKALDVILYLAIVVAGGYAYTTSGDNLIIAALVVTGALVLADTISRKARV